MRCFKCDFKNEGNICLNCGSNLSIVKKSLNMSNRFFNTALKMAQNKDFYNSIVYLEKSLYFNKRNIQSRNLLGLLYCKTGRLGDAIKHWIISSNFSDEKENLANYYLNIFSKNIRNFEKADDSIKLFNQAIEYLKNKNDDLAIIRLKKAIDISPDFVSALNLLSFCYIIQGEFKKALITSNKVLEIDINNPIALNYVRQVENKSKKEVLETEYKFNGKVDLIENKSKFARVRENACFPILLFLSGSVLAVLIMYFLFIPEYKNKKDLELKEANQKYVLANQNYENSIKETEDVVNNLKKETEDLKTKINQYEVQSKVKQNLDKIEHAIRLLDKNQKQDALNVINTVDTSNFTKENLEKYNQTKEKINKK